MKTRDDMTEDTRDALEMIQHGSIPVQGKLDGFTPLFDAIANESGIIRAAVFGKVWRHCQMHDKVCRASLETISTGLGIDRSTAARHLDALCEDGYLTDLTPDLRNAPHVYKDTGKVRVTVGLTVAQRNSSPKTVAQSNATVAESNMSIDSKIDKKITREKPPRETPALFSLAQSIATVCGMDFNANRGRLFREAKELSTAQPAPTPELVKQHYNGNPAAFWKRDDWRGQKGQLPTPGAIRETWGKWAAKPAPKSTNGWNLKAAK